MPTELLLKQFPTDRFLTSKQDLAFYGKDSCKEFAANPSLIFLPTSIDEVSTFLKICSENKIAVVPSGGRTGYSGGATATNGEVVCSLSKLNKILSLDASTQTITCEAGVITEAIQNAAEKHGLFYGVDFASKGSSQIGGNVATNAGGIRVIRYGNTRDWVLGLKVVIASGEILSLNGELIKNQTGYDLRHLFIGSEGTLGIIVEVTLRLVTKPLSSTTALLGLKTNELLPTLQEIRQAGFIINIFECFDQSCAELVLSKANLRNPFQRMFPMYALVEVEAKDDATKDDFDKLLEKLLEEELIGDVVVAQAESQRAEMVSLRERISETIGQHFLPHKNDISVSLASVPKFIEEAKNTLAKEYPAFSVLIFGHVGDGNLHINILKPEKMTEGEFKRKTNEVDSALFTLVNKYGGSISAEHGVGLLKKPYLHFSRTQSEIEMFRGIKQAFDPNNILNPGKIF